MNICVGRGISRFRKAVRRGCRLLQPRTVEEVPIEASPRKSRLLVILTALSRNKSEEEEAAGGLQASTYWLRTVLPAVLRYE